MMKKLALVILAIAAAAALLYFAGSDSREPAAEKEDGELSGISLPEGFSISVFAEGLNGWIGAGPNSGPRFMAYYEDVLLASLMRQGRVVALPDRNNDGKADEVITVAEGLRNPHGLAVHDGELYIAAEDRVVRGSIGSSYSLQNARTVISGIPSDGGHFTRTILVRDDLIYLSVGSKCNVCQEEHPWRAAVLKCTLSGECEIFASGLRNSVGLAFHPETGELWGTENERDWRGNDLPPDEINIIREGRNYGWPDCYGRMISDSSYGSRKSCEETEAPAVEIQAHSAPLGMAFYDGEAFPQEYRGDLFVAYHGSWNRDPPTGYKVARIRLKGSAPETEDFAAGWLDGDSVSGRPVDVIVAKDGALLVSDDAAAKIYRIEYSGNAKGNI